MATRRRTRARELALQFLYGADMRPDDELDPEPFLRPRARKDDIYAFALDLARGCLAHREQLDGEIQRVARNWDLHRIAAIDRNILRIGSYELLHRKDVPPQVTLNEAIELAKRFSTADSGRFVNGLLDRIRRDAGR